MNKAKIFVWDIPTRIFHWFFAAFFVIALMTSESEIRRDVHLYAGFSMMGLLAFRIVWGFVGNHYARFSGFAPSVLKSFIYIKSILNGNSKRYIGHNPAGSIAIFLLIGLGMATTLSGWLTCQDVAPDMVDELHEFFAYSMTGVVTIHISGVAFSSWLHRENLVLAMLTGKKDKRENPAD